MPRVSKARGGLLPGLQLSEISALQDTDDLDYVSRLQREKTFIEPKWQTPVLTPRS